MLVHVSRLYSYPHYTLDIPICKAQKRRFYQAMSTDYIALRKDGFNRQTQKDNFTMRLKVVGGNLTSAQLAAIAKASEKYGNGYVHLTSRQSVVIPFIKLEDIASVKAELEQNGVLTRFLGPRIRPVTACQGEEVCRAGNISSIPLAQEISSRYDGRDFPSKLKIGVSGCLNNCMKAEENDIGVKGGRVVKWQKSKCTLCGACESVCRKKAITQNDAFTQKDTITIDEDKCNNCGQCAKSCPHDAFEYDRVYIMSFGGIFGNTIAKGEEVLPVIYDKETLLRVTDAAINFYEKSANKGERFRILIDRVGWDKFKAEMEAAYATP